MTLVSDKGKAVRGGRDPSGHFPGATGGIRQPSPLHGGSRQTNFHFGVLLHIQGVHHGAFRVGIQF